MGEMQRNFSQNDKGPGDPARVGAGEGLDRRSGQFMAFMRWIQRSVVLTGLLYVVIGYVGDMSRLYTLSLVSLVLFIVVAIARWLVRVGRLNLAVYTFVGGMYVALSLLPLVVEGLVPAVITCNVIAVILVGLFVSPRLLLRMTVVTVAVSILPLLFDLWAPFSPLSVPAASIVLVLLAVAFAGGLIYLLGQTLSRALDASQRYARELERSQAELVARSQELEVAAADLAARGREQEATNVDLEETRRRQEVVNRDLEAVNDRLRRRAAQLQAIAEVGQAVSQMRDLDRLLPQVTQLISRHFGYYHVGVFLVDRAGRYAVLRAANSEGGLQMLDRGHKLPVGGQSIVGHVTGTGKPRVALDVGTDEVYFDNPDRPYTRSEMALPLRIGGQIIGALDVQSVEAEAFDDQDVAVLGALADQVSIAIENARLFQQSQEALVEAEEAQQRYLQQSWQKLLQQRPNLRFEYALEGVPSALQVELPATQQAVAQGELVAVPDVAAGNGDSAVARAVLSVPIKLGGQVIGVIDLHEVNASRVWTEHEMALVRDVADQMAQTVESARLFEQTRTRARHEQLVGRITTRMRAASSVQEVLQVTSEELGKTLGVSRSVVRLCPRGVEDRSPRPLEDQ